MMRGHRHVREWGAAERADSARRGGRAVSGQPQLGAARGKALAADVRLAARRHRCTAGAGACRNLQGAPVGHVIFFYGTESVIG